MNLGRSIVAIALASLLCGCGTMSNLESMNGPLMGRWDTVRPRPFGGVVNDLTWPSDSAWPVWPFYIMDLPVSLVADVLTLPKIRELQIEFDKRRESESVNPPALIPDDTSESN